MKNSSPVLVATDGASDETSRGVARAGVGGILIDRAAHTFCYFAGVLSDAAVQELLSESGNPIVAVELAAVLLCLALWHRAWGPIDCEVAKAMLCPRDPRHTVVLLGARTQHFQSRGCALAGRSASSSAGHATAKMFLGEV